MRKQLFQSLFLISMLVFLSACSGSKISTRIYAQDKARVDQEMNGNAGYIMGAPDEPIESPEKKTRRIYVLEVTKELDEAPKDEDLYGVDLSEEIERSTYDLPPRKKINQIPAQPKLTLPKFDEEEVVVTEPQKESVGTYTGTFQEYKVEENDTLQKISKKFYNSYSKWHKIYEVNKGVIKDPNYIKPGIVIKIPELQ